MSLKIGDNNLLHRAVVHNEKDLNAYLAQFVPKSKDVWDFFNIVEVHADKKENKPAPKRARGNRGKKKN